MKKIHLLILKSFVRPFIVTFFIVMFVLLMLFLWKYIDDMIGKGFDWLVIAQLMMYSSATNVVMALPLSVLLSSIMTYGALGENYELVAIKSAGISLGRALYPMLIVVGMLAVSAFLFSEYMLPVANTKFFSLLYDVRNQKTAFLIKENVFNNSIPGYAIRINSKDPDGRTLRGIMIYERTAPGSNNLNVSFADEGFMYRLGNNLVLQLKNGIRYQEQAKDGGNQARQQFTRFRFKQRVVKLDLSSFNPQRTPESEFKGQFPMMNTTELSRWRDSVANEITLSLNSSYGLVTPYFKYFSMPEKPLNKAIKYIKPKPDDLLAADHNKQSFIISNALTEAKSIKSHVKLSADGLAAKRLETRRNWVEYEKKFTLSAACLVLFLIGAPLGAIIRKGGLGLPVVVAVIFFLIYYIISTIGEKFVKDGDLSPHIGMWIAIAILTPIGLFLSHKAANDSEIFNADAYNKFIAKVSAYIKNKKAPA